MDGRKKSKATSTQLLASEDLLQSVSDLVGIRGLVQKHTGSESDQFSSLTKCLRLPHRRLENGHSIQSAIRKQLDSKHALLHCDQAESSDEEVFSTKRKGKKKPYRTAHPALARIYKSIPTSLSAFDQSVCETQSWTNKYAPSSAEETLQTGAEAFILREWLRALIVDVVHTGSRDVRPKAKGRRGPSASQDDTTQKKKKKRKPNPLDDFIVDDNESGLEEVTHSENESIASDVQGTQKKTMVRTRALGAKGSKVTGKVENAVIVSGPHGCGKTAAVYAVAKELGFEVFEINPNTRRSGKDILEKVGDMTRNHLVQRTSENFFSPASSNNTESLKKAVDNTVDEEVKSGRQGTMQSFFQPSSKTKKPAQKMPKKQAAPPPPEPAPKPKAVSQNMINSFFQPKKVKSKPEDTADKLTTTSAPPSEIIPAVDSAVTPDIPTPSVPSLVEEVSPKEQVNEEVNEEQQDAPVADPEDPIPSTKSEKQPKKQKQSLILLEEVDILFEEDKQFWQTVLTLLAQSKRPVIMTCTDESVVPIHTLPLHAIIRFQAAPVDLATDYLLLAAANEGHFLEREAVKSLYQLRDCDLRASLTELNFWCQMAIGDQKGGLEWFQPRWPPGCDKDAEGQTIRVVSEHTYQDGMGLFSQDFLGDHVNSFDVEEEMLREAWDNYGLDAGDWHESLDLEGWSLKCHQASQSNAKKSYMLESYESFVETLSLADVCGHGEFGLRYQTKLDPSLPEISTKSKEDYITGYGLLQADEFRSYSRVTLEIALWMRSCARRELRASSKQNSSHDFPELLPLSEADLDAKVRDKSDHSTAITRRDFSLAFDPISEPPSKSTSASTSSSLDICTFDRNLSLIAIDVAPFVRNIVNSDVKLHKERERLSKLLDASGHKSKRMRTTRAAMSALEGGVRQSTRRERYFGNALDATLVLRTGLQEWQDAVEAEVAGEKADLVTEPGTSQETEEDRRSGSERASPDTSPDSPDSTMEDAPGEPDDDYPMPTDSIMSVEAPPTASAPTSALNPPSRTMSQLRTTSAGDYPSSGANQGSTQSISNDHYSSMQGIQEAVAY